MRVHGPDCALAIYGPPAECSGCRKVEKSWREIARPIIADIIRGCGYPRGCDLKFIRKALRGTYPFGMREYWPYTVWCDEVRRQLRAAEGRAGAPWRSSPHAPVHNPAQQELWRETERWTDGKLAVVQECGRP